MEEINGQEESIIGDMDAWFASFEAGTMAEAYDGKLIASQRMIIDFGERGIDPYPYDASID